ARRAALRNRPPPSHNVAWPCTTGPDSIIVAPVLRVEGERAVIFGERLGRAAEAVERIAAAGPGAGETRRERERAIGRDQRFVKTFEVGERVAAIAMCDDE